MTVTLALKVGCQDINCHSSPEINLQKCAPIVFNPDPVCGIKGLKINIS